MTELVNAIDKTLHFNEKNIRVLGTNEDTWYIAKDICVVLGFKNVTEALRHVPENQRGVTLLNPNTSQNCIKITEQAMYKLIMRSNKEPAQKFQDYICGEILPSIRKTGTYKLEELCKDYLNTEDINLPHVLEKENKQLIEELKKLRHDIEAKEKQLVEDSNKLRQNIDVKEKKIKQLIQESKNIKDAFEAKEKILIKESNELKLQLEERTKEDDVKTFIEKTKQSQDSPNIKQKTQLIKESEGLFNCNLKLFNNTFMTIPMRKDGYINATLLCKAGGKKFNDWNRLKNTNELITALESETGFPVSQLIDVKKGNSYKYEQGSWIHPDLAIQIAQWISPRFAIQVSRWTREILVYGKVEIGNEKSSEELENKFKERIDQLTQEKDLLEQVVETKEKDIKTLQTDLLQEQKDVISTKKSLMKTQFKFSHRHKFREASCVYILQDPDCKYNKFKIGLTTDINQRLANDRTMIPNIKVRHIMYNDHCELFEKAIKVRCKDTLELPSHEWVFESLDNLIKIYNEIDKSNGFSSIIETDLWRYNLEPPPSEEYQKLEPVNIPTYYGKPTSEINRFLSGPRLIRCDYLIKNNNAPQGQRWCNGWCQCYKIATDFAQRSASPMTICIHCENMLDVAIIKVENGIMTEEEILKNPSRILLAPDEQICRACNIIKKTKDFDPKKRQCKKCRQSVRNKFKVNFDEIVESEVAILKSLPKYDRDKRLKIYIRDQLFKIASICKIGRKDYDIKQTIFNSLVIYFDNVDTNL
jgi:prophage antirepressor-like protein